MDYTKMKEPTVLKTTVEKLRGDSITVEKLYYGDQDIRYRLNGNTEVSLTSYWILKNEKQKKNKNGKISF
jgi:hypothetical protein